MAERIPTSERYLVVSTDGHAGLLPEKYRDYLDPQYRERFDAQIGAEIAARVAREKDFLIDEFNERWRAGNDAKLAAAWDSDLRIEVIDGDGVAAEVLFPDGITERNAPPFGAGLGLRPYGVVWAHEQGLRGILIPALTGDHAPYNHPRYYPVWRACEERGMVVHNDSGPGPDYDFTLPGAMGVFLVEFAWWAARPLWHLIFGGVFELFPRLQYCLTEVSEFWVPSTLELMDVRASVKHTSGKLGDFRSNLTMKPSDYFRRNCWLSASALFDEGSTDVRHDIGMSRIMWGTDFPHPEGSWPHTREKMQRYLTGIPEPERTQLLGSNAVRCYGLDVDQLAPIAARIGPEKSLFVPAT